MNRRRYLALLPGVATAGCLSALGPEARLGDVLFVNRTDATREARLRVELDGEVVFDRTTEVPASDDRTTAVAGDWSDARGRLVVTASSGGTTNSLELTGEACYSLIVELHEEYVAFFTGEDPPACETATA